MPTFFFSKLQPAWQAMFPASRLQRTDATLAGTRGWGLALTEFLVGFGIVIFSSFIAKRRLLLASNVFQLEGAVFRAWPSMRSREIPIDLMGYGLLIPVFFAAYFFAVYSSFVATRPSTSLTVNATPMFVEFMLYGLLFLYALYRRIKIGQW